MKNKIFMGFAAFAAVVIALPMFAAFEAHVVNVTARIENALSVPITPINFGTVFPQEKLEKPLEVDLSGSFLSENRVDDVNYVIRQKPKCGITTLNGQTLVDGSTVTGHVFPGTAPVDATHTFVQFTGYYVDCGVTPQVDATHMFGMLPMLCPYISKHPDGKDDNGGTTTLGATNDGSLNSFHHPFDLVNATSGPKIVWNDTVGHLAKSETDTKDAWTIDLAVPCFGGYCAQDWASFVHGVNPTADPNEYTQPITNEHKVFGCDLWVEVTGVSQTPN